MVCLFSRNDWGVSDQGEMDTRVGNQVGLELGEIHIECSIKAERGSDGRHNLTNETVEIGVGRAFNVEIPAADVVDSFIVDHEGTVRVLQSGVGGEDGVVRLNNGC